MKVFAALSIFLFAQTAFAQEYVIRGRDGSLSRVAFQSLQASFAEAEAASLSPCLIMLSSGEAVACEPNAEIRISNVPNDPELPRQWGMSSSQIATNVTDAWSLSTGSQAIVVAVIDTGAEFGHPDLRDNLWTNTGEIAENGIDDDGNGYVDDVHGANFLTPQIQPFDDNGHGTHVSGIIGASGDNWIGVSGVNWRVNLLVAKALNSLGSGSLFDAVKAFDYIIDLKVNRGVNIGVINTSWGMPFRSEILKDCVDRSIAAGIIVVAAAGNYGQNADQFAQYPAAFESDGVVSVAALTQAGELANFSNYGRASVDIAAPGVNILSTYPNGWYTTMSGTSMAAPFVSGALALLQAYEPGLPVAAQKDRLLKSGTDLQALAGVIYSGRTLNISRLLRNIVAPILVAPLAGAPRPSSELSLLYFDGRWRSGSRKHAYILGGRGDHVYMRIKSSLGSCTAKRLQFKDSLMDLVVRVPKANISGTMKFELLNSSKQVVESKRVRLSASSGSRRVISLNRVGRNSFKRWCSEVRAVGR